MANQQRHKRRPWMTDPSHPFHEIIKQKREFNKKIIAGRPEMIARQRLDEINRKLTRLKTVYRSVPVWELREKILELEPEVGKLEERIKMLRSHAMFRQLIRGIDPWETTAPAAADRSGAIAKAEGGK